MNINSKNRVAFSLIEILAVVVIAGMIIVVVLSVYGKAQATVTAIDARIDGQMLPNEILQRIAEDIDRLTLPGLDTVIGISNKFDGRYNLAQLTISTRFYDSSQPPRAQVFEKIVWQSAYDPVEDALTLYRSHSGINLEDKIVDKDLADRQRTEGELFIPVTTGITFFEIVVPREGNPLRNWRLGTPPRSIRVTISLAPPREDWTTGEFVVFDEDKVSRTIAIDRTRMIPYKFVRKEFKLEETEPNSIDAEAGAGGEDSETGTTVPPEDETTTTAAAETPDADRTARPARTSGRGRDKE